MDRFWIVFPILTFRINILQNLIKSNFNKIKFYWTIFKKLSKPINNNNQTTPVQLNTRLTTITIPFRFSWTPDFKNTKRWLSTKLKEAFRIFQIKPEPDTLPNQTLTWYTTKPNLNLIHYQTKPEPDTQPKTALCE